MVREVNPSLDARSRSLTAEARLTKNDARLRPGMFVQVRLLSTATRRSWWCRKRPYRRSPA